MILQTTTPRKTPQRKPSQRKVARILEAAHHLLDEFDVTDVTVAMLAAHSGVSRTTIYDFFPSVMAVYEQLAQEHVRHSYDFMVAYLEREKPVELLDVVSVMVDAAVAYFNSHVASRKTMLGTGALEMHLIVEDFEGLCAELYHRAYKGDWHFETLGPEDPFRHLAIIQSALYTNSVQRHGSITPYMAAQVKAAGRGYLKEVVLDNLVATAENRRTNG